MKKTGARGASFRLFLFLYPFVSAAVAVNLFMLGLAVQSLGLPAIPPMKALLGAMPLGIPATWLSARWVSKLVAEAEK